jgi:hypothetical protein
MFVLEWSKIFACLFIAELVVSITNWIIYIDYDWTSIKQLIIMFISTIIPERVIHWIISQLDWPEILSIPEPSTDLVLGDENPLPAEDCRHRIPKTTRTELHEVANEHHKSMDRPCVTQNEELIEECQEKVEISKQISDEQQNHLEKLIEKNNLPDVASNSLLPDENGSSEISEICALKDENKRLNEEICELKSRLQLVTDERAEERSDVTELYHRTIDYYENYLVQQDELVFNLTEERNELKITLADREEKLLETMECKTDLELSFQQFKEEIITVCKAQLAEKQKIIDRYDEFLAPRILQLEEENASLKDAQSRAEKARTTPKKHVATLFDEPLIDSTAEDEGKRNTGATMDTGQVKNGKQIKNLFVKKGFSKTNSSKPFLSVLELAGCLIIDKAKSLKEITKKMKARVKS